MDQARVNIKRIGTAAWTLWAAAIFLCLFSLAFRTWNTSGLMSKFRGADWLMEMLYWSVLIPLAVPAFATASVWIASRLPRHPVGWLCLAIALVIGLQDALWQYVMRAYDLSPGMLPASPWLLWFLAILSTLEQPPLPFLLLLLRFPTGSLPSWRWRYAELVVLGIAAFEVLITVLLLHDGLGPQLAALNLQAGTIRTLLRRDPQAADTAIVELRQEIQSAITEIRRLVYDLRPPSLDELGLVGAIHRQVEQVETDGLSITLKAPEALPVPPAAVEVAAYRITQEALTNIIHHARAEHGCVSLKLTSANDARQPAFLEIEVSDDGCGFSADQSRGVGITSMRERAEELGGTCRVEAAIPSGTRVLARLPIFP